MSCKPDEVELALHHEMHEARHCITIMPLLLFGVSQVIIDLLRTLFITFV